MDQVFQSTRRVIRRAAGLILAVHLWCFGAFTGVGQTMEEVLKIDSLEQQLKMTDPSEQLILLDKLVHAYESVSADLVIHSLKRQLILADSISSANHQTSARIKLSVWLMKKADTASSIALIEEALLIGQQQSGFTETQLNNNADGSMSGKSFNWRSASIWRIILLMTLLMLPVSVVLMLRFSHQLKEKYIRKQDEFGTFQLEMEKQRQQLEAMIQNRTKELEDQLQQNRAKDLELKKTLKRLKDASYLKNAFLSNMSHEIRTPLNGIIGFSSLLETELALMENKELYHYASGIQQSGDRLLNLINNIIEISRIQANEVEVDLHPCDVSLIVQNVCEPLQFTANEKGLKFKQKLPEVPQVLADNAKLMRVLHIIIDNAVKYTESGFVTITLSHDETTNLVTVKVKDTGVGMDPGYMSYLFEAFRQESNGYNRQYQGAGLGLPLAKKLLDLMHAQIQITSERGQGTTVEVSLPVLKTDTEDIVQPTVLKPIANAPQIGALDIFIVEDDRMNRMVLQKLLSKAGNLTLAVDGNETMKIVGERYKRGHVFQVMLFDINLPAPWDGVKLMQQIRTDYPDYKFIPFIAQTAYAMAGDKERFLDAGFDDYIAKPINKNELMTKIENQLNIRKLSADLS